ncbi:MAG TPA: sialate O-acetylesterase [Sediminibacterium sp.]|uniref:sialate O-acetylesterase n=1 Tax=Sediminibacterium sp. TaxID=1917865 RepID=UPI0008B28774|nr:sialate O-acetylesterase [Sediminibacterium sp.]OHC86344.1 MAG: hypothetical protein A2472_01880 [Sphingobacteriia bacterium RIFOXYC2_FULL_35_18]OHC89856.1 MAG: hypothetical protein A2546_11125 [Sphingobacteriia bacterium RIFOXYD2_FULL_35_12]HLD54240.1 sialate O-acetylesterase [Sediminibacterium sp.]
MNNKLLVLVAWIFSLHIANAQTAMPSLFSNDMVLQQQTMTALWGTDKPGTKIMITGSWGNSATTITSKDGHWRLKIQTPIAGGPYTMNIKGTKTLSFKNVLIGEVWLCSGQSNMEMPLKGFNNQPIYGSNEAILNATNPNIRFYTSPRNISITPLYDAKSEWKTASPENAPNFSATAYFFAKKIQSILNIPVGIIHTSWGGSSIESWMDAQSLASFKNKKIPEALPVKDPNKVPTVMYNGMLHPFIGYAIKGALWYQGETNRDNAYEYKDLFTKMINEWRNQWQQGDFPFYFVQIAPYLPGNANSAFLREAQLQTMLAVKNTGMAVTLDIGEQNLIHPPNKELVGNRLAYWALAKEYNVKGIAYSGPIYHQMEKTTDHKIILSFHHADLGFSGFGKPFIDFEIAGEDKIFHPAQVKINPEKKSSLIIWNDSIKNPLSVRYAFKSWAVGSLYNIQGLPASSFRTDEW